MPKPDHGMTPAIILDCSVRTWADFGQQSVLFLTQISDGILIAINKMLIVNLLQ